MSSKNTIQVTVIALVVLVFLYLVKIFDISYPLTIVNTTKSTELAMVGEGKVEAVPDTASIDLGITVDNAPTVGEVQTKINEVNNKIVAAMKDLGIDKTNIKTSSYSISPSYSYESGQNRITGYNGNASVNIKIKNISLVARVIEEGTKAGANQVQGAQFSIDKPEKIREQARNLAIANAKEQAQNLAKTLGIKLGKITNIVESQPTDVYPPQYRALSSEKLGGGSPEIEPGSQTITSVITLYFEKK